MRILLNDIDAVPLDSILMVLRHDRFDRPIADKLVELGYGGHLYLLADLQYVHDYIDPSDWHAGLANVARNYNLTLPR